MSGELYRAAARLGVLAEAINSNTLPEAAVESPADYVLVLDGREVNDNTIAVWLCKRKGKTKLVVEAKAAVVPRRSAHRPAIYAHADRIGVERVVLDRRGLKVERTVAKAPTGSLADLTGVILTLAK